jgi:hypothetical protein
VSVRDLYPLLFPLDRLIAEYSREINDFFFFASSRLNVNTPSTPKLILSPHYFSRLQRISDISRPSSSHPSTTDRTITYRTPVVVVFIPLHVLDEHLELLLSVYVLHVAVVVINAVLPLVIEQGSYRVLPLVLWPGIYLTDEWCLFWIPCLDSDHWTRS